MQRPGLLQDRGGARREAQIAENKIGEETQERQVNLQIQIFKRQFKTQDIRSRSKLISQEKKDFRVFENESCLISLSWTTLRSQSQNTQNK